MYVSGQGLVASETNVSRCTKHVLLYILLCNTIRRVGYLLQVRPAWLLSLPGLLALSLSAPDLPRDEIAETETNACVMTLKVRPTLSRMVSKPERKLTAYYKMQTEA